MTPEVADRVEPILSAVLALRAAGHHGRRPDLDRERDRLHDMLDGVRTLAGPAARDADLIRRCLTYWSDEALQAKYGDDWGRDLLEWRSYGTRDRGYRFYYDFERDGRHAGADAAEVWYLASSLGFQGDILLAFEKLGREPPGLRPDERPDARRAREAWVRALARRVAREDLPSLEEGPPLDGDVRPLRGGTLLRGAAVLTGVAGLLAAGLGWAALSR